MNLDELDGLRQQRHKDVEEKQKLAKEIAQLESLIKPALMPDALQRFGAIKTADPKKAVQAMIALAPIVQSGKRINDEIMKSVLMEIEPVQRKITIRRV